MKDKQHEHDAILGLDDEKSGAERRQYIRYPITLPVDYGDGENFLFSYIDNISEMGIFIRSNEPLPIGTRITMRFGDKAQALHMVGTVMWHNPVRLGADNLNPGMGVCFEELEPEDRERVVSLIRTVAYLDRLPSN